MPDDVLNALDVEERARGWRNRLDLPNFDAFVAELSGIIGFCTLVPSRDVDALPHVGEISAIYVNPSRWRQGVGRRLVAAAVSQAQSRRFDRISLWVLCANDGARSFYDSLGFQHDGNIKTDASLIGFPLKEARYVLDLKSQAA